ncbi:MAG: helix-turn-helix transcriptional regulator [Ruminococcus sp.]|nr:helix-turn-helix transcriptional regulator [Ruminococcus sp.]
MIYCNLSGLIAEKHINISVLSKETDISRTTLTSLYYNNFKGIQTETLNSLCKYFEISADKLLVFSKYDISVELTDGKVIDFQNKPKRTDNTICFNISFGKIQRKCRVYCGLYFDWHSGYVYIEPDVLYYVSETNPQNDREKDIADNNAFFKKVFSGLPVEIKNYVLNMVQNLITNHINAELTNSNFEVKIGRVSFNDLI